WYRPTMRPYSDAWTPLDLGPLCGGGQSGFNAPAHRGRAGFGRAGGRGGTRAERGMELKDMLQVAIDVGARFGIRIIGAIALWIVGRALIGFCVRFIGRWL